MGDLSISSLNKVDELRKLGLGSQIALPQIAVIGDQSSGKSSLLEYISGITFPKGLDMCTTFATQVIMRPGDSFSAKISLGKNNDLGIEMPKTPAEIENVIETVKKSMPAGISDELLNIEIIDKNYPLLTLIDLPGYVHTSIDGQSDTIVQDIETIVDRYVTDKRTIILAVIPANKDVATNVVLNKAAKCDPNGERTMGVITKPDLMDAGTEHLAVNIIQGMYKKLNLGYHMIRNKNFAEVRDKTSLRQVRRNEREFFKADCWNQLTTADWGVDSLKKKLVSLLQTHVAREMPHVRSEIEERAGVLREQLQELGPAIDESNRSFFLSRNAQRFCMEWSNLINGYYIAFCGRPDLYIRAKCQDLNKKFTEQIIKDGKTDLDSAYIAELIHETKGRELEGFVQFDPFVHIIRQLIQGWPRITANHINNVTNMVNLTALEIIENSVDPVLINVFKCSLNAYHIECRANMNAAAREIFDDEQKPMTYTEYMDEEESTNLSSIRESIIKAVQTPDDYNSRVTEIVNFANEIQSPNQLETSISRMSKHVKGYYYKAAARYADAICLYVIERILFKNGPDRINLKILRDTDLNALVEDLHITKRRETLNKNLSALEEALTKLY